MSIDLALTVEAIEIIINLTKDKLSLVSVVNTDQHKANFLDFCLKIEIGMPMVAVLYTLGHFSTVLIHRVSQSKVIVYSFDSQGNGAKYNIEDFLENNLALLKENAISFEIIPPLLCRQQKNEPLCYAYAIKDALLIKKCLEDKKTQITHLHHYFFSSLSHYNARNTALIIYEILILKSYQLAHDHLAAKLLFDEKESQSSSNEPHCHGAVGLKI